MNYFDHHSTLLVLFSSLLFLENYNFEDTGTASLEITVAGGPPTSCDFKLGNATIVMTVPGCSWPGKQFSQGEVSAKYSVPAQKLELQVTSVSSSGGEDIPVISEHFQDPSRVQTVDLIEVAEQMAMAQTYEDAYQKENPDSNSTSALFEIMYSPPVVRFQYDGTLRMDIDIYGHAGANFNSPGDAYPGTVWGCNDPPSNTALLNNSPLSTTEVLPFSWKATLYYEIETYSGMQQCNDAASDEDGSPMAVNVTSEVGIDYIKNPPFEEWAPTASVSQSELESCSPLSGNNSCSEQALYDTTAESTYAHGTLYAGRPNIDPPYTKPLTFQVIGHDVRKEIDCIVTGAFGDSPFQSIEVPEYLPIMILRDPPGSGSYGERVFF